MPKVLVVDINDENHEELVKIALSMYLGERCKYCFREFKTLDDLHDTVWVGYNEYGRIAHESCYVAALDAVGGDK